VRKNRQPGSHFRPLQKSSKEPNKNGVEKNNKRQEVLSWQNKLVGGDQEVCCELWPMGVVQA
jgi:hypothetical protein